MDFKPALQEHLAGVIPGVAQEIRKGCKVIPAEDLEQGMWEYAARRGDRLGELLAEGKTWSVQRALRHAAGRQIREEERYQRAKRAMALGYSTDDEAFYSTGLLAQLIPLYLDGGVAAEPPKGREVSREVSSTEESGNYLALMLDVDRAMGAISEHHRKILQRYYAYPQGSGGWTHEEISGAMGITPDACRQRVHRARRAMQRYLGGENPWKRPAQDDRQEAPPLRRREEDTGAGRC